MANNALLFNAALNGAYAGMLHNRMLTSATQADYTPLADAAEAFATDVDTAIANDPLISDGDGTPAAPADGAIAGDQFRLTNIVFALAYAAWANREAPSVAIAGGQAVLVAALKEAYDEAKTVQLPGA